MTIQRHLYSSRIPRQLLAASLVILLTGLGCAEDLSTNSDEDDNQVNQDNEDNQAEETSAVQSEVVDGVTTTVVDATDEQEAILVSLFDGTQISDADDVNWHLSMQRFAVEVNGGVSGPGEVAIQIVDGADFEQIDQAPDGIYFTDTQGEPDERGQNPGLVFQSEGGWYEYDQNTHSLTPRDRTYLLHLDGENFVKLQLLDYYDEAGTGGFITFKWAAIDPPAGAYEVGELPLDDE